MKLNDSSQVFIRSRAFHEGYYLEGFLLFPEICTDYGEPILALQAQNGFQMLTPVPYSIEQKLRRKDNTIEAGDFVRLTSTVERKWTIEPTQGTPRLPGVAGLSVSDFILWSRNLRFKRNISKTQHELTKLKEALAKLNTRYNRFQTQNQEYLKDLQAIQRIETQNSRYYEDDNYLTVHENFIKVLKLIKGG